MKILKSPNEITYGKTKYVVDKLIGSKVTVTHSTKLFISTSNVETINNIYTEFRLFYN